MNQGCNNFIRRLPENLTQGHFVVRGSLVLTGRIQVLISSSTSSFPGTKPKPKPA